MALLNQLGPYVFHTINGTLQFPQANIVGQTRPGVNGITFVHVGTWGRPFDLLMMQYTLNRNAAIEAAEYYSLASAMNPLPLILGGYLISQGLFKVMDVENLEIGAIVNKSTPGDSTPYRGIVRSRWTLVPVASFT